MNLKGKKIRKRSMRKNDKKKVMLNRDLDNLYALSKELTNASNKLRTKAELYSFAAMYQKKMSELTDVALKRMVNELEIFGNTTIKLKKIALLLKERVISNDNIIIDASILKLVNENEKINDI